VRKYAKAGADAEEDIELFRRGCSLVAVVGKAGYGLDDTTGIADKITGFQDS
jgi:hypothetical protein